MSAFMRWVNDFVNERPAFSLVALGESFMRDEWGGKRTLPNDFREGCECKPETRNPKAEW